MLNLSTALEKYHHCLVKCRTRSPDRSCRPIVSMKKWVALKTAGYVVICYILFPVLFPSPSRQLRTATLVIRHMPRTKNIVLLLIII